MKSLQSELTNWSQVEVDTSALRHNIGCFRFLIGEKRLLVVVKSEGYGHGLELAAKTFIDGGADLLGVHSFVEAARLRTAGITKPILILGPVNSEEAVQAESLDIEITVASVIAAGQASGSAKVHLKIETGVNRQGLVENELEQAVQIIGAGRIAGISSHYANIEDTTDHSFAKQQTARFEKAVELLTELGATDLETHMSCSAAAILWPEAERQIVRVGISAYGIWPSRETLVTAKGELELKPAMRWTCKVSQIRNVPAGETVGYGRSWAAPIDSRIAVLPIGYADGYPRSLSGRSHVLINGQQAPVRGRVCMNLIMVDVTNIPEAKAGDNAVLLGDGITAEKMADWLNTIPYEVLTLPSVALPRVEV
ncbi:MAG: alanine racemase [bacterium]|nr:alanine racemase [bacterium]